MNKPQRGKRQKLKAVVGMSAASGAGKTLSALLLAKGMMNRMFPDMPDAERWEKIGVLDTEHSRALYYAETTRAGVDIGNFWHMPLDAPYSVERYVEGIDMLKDEGCEVIIVDSASHGWSKEGGLLDLHNQITQASSSKNSYMAWKDVNPVEAKLNKSLFENDVHMIVTMRSKQEYAMEHNELGKMQITKLGTKPVQRDDMEYEFMTVFTLDQQHMARVSKDNTAIFDGKAFVIGVNSGEQLYDWLEVGIDVRAVERERLAAQKAKYEADMIVAQELLDNYPEIKAFIDEVCMKRKTEFKKLNIEAFDKAFGLMNTKKKEIDAKRAEEANGAKTIDAAMIEDNQAPAADPKAKGKKVKVDTLEGKEEPEHATV